MPPEDFSRKGGSKSTANISPGPFHVENTEAGVAESGTYNFVCMEYTPIRLSIFFFLFVRLHMNKRTSIPSMSILLTHLLGIITCSRKMCVKSASSHDPKSTRTRALRGRSQDIRLPPPRHARACTTERTSLFHWITTYLQSTLPCLFHPSLST